MGLRINTNVFALASQNALRAHTVQLGRSFQRLATGLRINSAADDAAGLAISEGFRAEIRGLEAAQRNANDGISLVQTGEGALNETSDILLRLRELAVQSSNGTLSNADKDALDTEFQQLVDEVDRISNSTDFNGTNLLDTDNNAITLQVGSGTATTDTIDVTFDSASASSLGVNSLDIGSGGNTSAAITAIDAAIDTVSTIRANLGASQNRLESTVNSLDSRITALQAADSRIRDADIASETSLLTRNSILQQAALSILVQSNLSNQGVIQALVL